MKRFSKATVGSFIVSLAFVFVFIILTYLAITSQSPYSDLKNKFLILFYSILGGIMFYCFNELRDNVIRDMKELKDNNKFLGE